MALPIARLAAQDKAASSVTTSVAATYAGVPTAGNTCIAVVGANVAAGVVSVDNSFVLVDERVAGGNVVSLWAKIQGAGGATVTATAAGATAMQIHLYEYSGIRNVFVPAVDAQNKNSSAVSVTTLGTGAISTVFADDLVFVCCWVGGGSNGGGTSWATATNLQAGVVNRLMSGQYLPAAELTNFADTASWTTARSASLIIVAFQPEQTAASSSDTGTGTDAGESVAAAVQTSETGTATDDGAVAGALTDTETGTGTDAGESVAAAVTESETATGTDDGTTALSITGDESGATTETETADLATSDTDSGAAADAEGVAVPASDDDPGSAVEVGAVALALTDTETGTSTEVDAVALAITDGESGTLADEIGALALTLTADDLAGVIEGTVIVVSVSGNETGTATDDGDVDTTELGGWLVGAAHL